jgi:hypothetical protein
VLEGHVFVLEVMYLSVRGHVFVLEVMYLCVRDTNFASLFLRFFYQILNCFLFVFHCILYIFYISRHLECVSMSVETKSTTIHKHLISHQMNVFISISLYYILLGRNDMDVNEHVRLSNITLRYKLK